MHCPWMWALSITQLRISTDHLYRLTIEYHGLLCAHVHSASQGNSRATPLLFRGWPQPKRRACQKLQPRQTQLHKGDSEIRQFLQPSISKCYHSNTVGGRPGDGKTYTGRVYPVLYFVARSVPVLCRQRATSAFYVA